MDTPIDVDEANQWKHDSEFVKIIKNMYMTHVLYQFFQEKSIENCLRYVSGLQFMLIDVVNVNHHTVAAPPDNFYPAADIWLFLLSLWLSKFTQPLLPVSFISQNLPQERYWFDELKQGIT